VGRHIGAVAIEGPGRIATFEYTADFSRSPIELSPLVMPLAERVYQFPELPIQSFHGLPGMLAGSLPDKFGNAVIEAWLTAQGRLPGEIDAVERLCYTGTRGTGALEFQPAQGPQAQESVPIMIASLVELASDVLRRRHDLKASLADRGKEHALREILRVGASAGGARAKAVIAWNPSTNEARSGQATAPPGFEYWLLKFDGVSDNIDKDLSIPLGFGAIEYAYSLMAREAGIRMTECRLFEEGSRRHFMTRRFDRLERGEKLHMQSLAALATLISTTRAAIHTNRRCS
jgi:serine/threonine-protein kinase HipA